ncbi:MAG: cell division protein ZapA [Desulfobacterales bacterium]|nr:cell division protein ZapA [Desulfobacterales bacterium]
MEQLVTINIFGQSYTFKSESDVTSAKEVADYLEQEVARVAAQQNVESTSISNLAVLLMAALNIAGDHVELRRVHAELHNEISKRSSVLIEKLDVEAR